MLYWCGCGCFGESAWRTLVTVMDGVPLGVLPAPLPLSQLDQKPCARRSTALKGETGILWESTWPTLVSPFAGVETATYRPESTARHSKVFPDR